jgi:eukaryotic-like serine/threonine-protein kinase
MPPVGGAPCGGRTGVVVVSRETQPDDWSTFSTPSRLGGRLIDQKKHAEPGSLILVDYKGREALESKISAPTKPSLTETAALVVKLYDSWGKKDEAAEQCAEVARPSDEPNHRP